MAMKTLSLGKHSTRPIIGHAAPIISRDPKTKAVRHTENGEPIYHYRPPTTGRNESTLPVSITKLLVNAHVCGSSPLSRSALTLVLYLAAQLPYAEGIILHGDDGEPVSFDVQQNLVSAIPSRYGSRVPARTMEQLKAGSGIKRNETINDAIAELKARGIIDDYEPTRKPTLRRQRGRPLKVFYLEFHPEYAWAGTLATAQGYVKHVNTQETERFIPTDPKWRMPNVKG